MKKIVIGMFVITGILFAGYFLLKEDSIVSPAAPLQNDTTKPSPTPTPLPQTPTIDETTDLYLETQKLIPPDFTNDYTELKTEANSI